MGMRAPSGAVFAAALAIFFTGASPSAHAVSAEKYFIDSKDMIQDVKYATGDWGGMRTSLEADKGVTFASSYVCDILGNVTGGREQGARYDHSVGWDVNFDLEKFAGIKNTQFHISALWRQGQNLSSATIGNSLVASSIYGHEQFRFYGLWIDRVFFDGALTVRAGRIAAGDDFASSPLYWTYVSNGIDGNPITIPINLFYSCYPTAVWGARALVKLPSDFWLKSAIYNGDPGVQRDSMYGLDFSMRLKEGIFTAQEISYTPNALPGSKGMPGNYKAGFYYHGGTFRDLYSDVNGASCAITGQAQKKHVGNYGIYLHADQMVYREKGPGTDQGLTPIAAAAFAPGELNQFGIFFMTGLIYKGLVPGRDQDVTAVQFQYARWGSSYRANERDAGAAVKSYESVVEFTHKLMITQWMYLQPDMQYIINPGGAHDIDDAFVIGTRFGIIF